MFAFPTIMTEVFNMVGQSKNIKVVGIDDV